MAAPDRNTQSGYLPINNVNLYPPYSHFHWLNFCSFENVPGIVHGFLLLEESSPSSSVRSYLPLLAIFVSLKLLGSRALKQAGYAEIQSLWAQASAGPVTADDPKTFSSQNVNHNTLTALCMTTGDTGRTSAHWRYALRMTTGDTGRVSADWRYALYQNLWILSRDVAEWSNLILAWGLDGHPNNTMSIWTRVGSVVRHT